MIRNGTKARSDSPPPESSDFLIYRALLDPEGPALAEWARMASRGSAPVDPNEFRAAIDRLHDHGLVYSTRTNERQLRAIDPAVVEKTLIPQLLGQAETALKQVNQIRTELIPAIETYQRAQSTEEDWLLQHTGLASISCAIVGAAQRCVTSVATVQPKGQLPADLPKAPLELVRDVLERGVALRSLFQHSARSDQAIHTYAKSIHNSGAEVRTLDEGVSWLLIFDDECAFIPAAPGHPAVLEVRSPGVVAFLTTLFERDWLRATPFMTPGKDEVSAQISDELMLAILRHVVAGDTDTVTAQQIGISVRRCQEYVARAARKLGSRSRAQLGYLVTRSGLLDDR